MTAALLYGPNDLRLEEVPAPQIGAGELLIRVKAASICGTDVRMLRNGHAAGGALVPGHEVSGTIERLGAGVEALREGDRVVVGPNIGCGSCRECRKGDAHLCRDYRALGIHLAGGFAEFMRVPAEFVSQGNVFRLSTALPLEEASLFEPLSCVCNAFERAAIREGDSVLIFGAGPIGLLHAKMARLAGAAPVMMYDPNPERMEAAMRIVPSLARFDTAKRGADVCITACAAPEAQVKAIELCAINGRVILFGGLPAGQATVVINTNLIHYRQLVVTGTTRASLGHIHTAVELLESGTIRVDDLISSRYALSEIGSAFERAATGHGLKHVIVFQ